MRVDIVRFEMKVLLLRSNYLLCTLKKLNSNKLLINMGIGLAIAKRSVGIALPLWVLIQTSFIGQNPPMKAHDSLALSLTLV